MQNLNAGVERLGEKLEKHFHRPKKRKPTRSTKGAKERRHEGKRNTAGKKAGRRKPGRNDF
jgi:hypothetical protein